MEMITLPKHSVDRILKILKFYDKEDKKTYQTALKEAGHRKFWNDVPTPNSWMSSKALHNLEYNLEPDRQLNNQKLSALNLGCSLPHLDDKDDS